MPLFLCRWPNGDCSVVLGSNKDQAVITLDEIANAEGCPIRQLRSFQIHFSLSDRGTIDLEGMGEETEEEVFSIAYPVLGRTLVKVYGDGEYDSYEKLPAEHRTAIAKAVKHERTRVKPDERRIKEPQTERGREVKKQTDAPTVLLDRMIREVATESLKRFRGRSKPS